MEQCKENLKILAKKNVERALELAVKSGLFYEDLCKIFADTLNKIAKENK